MAIVAAFVLFAMLLGMTWNWMVRARRERQRREQEHHQGSDNGKA
jgi:type II secretory pathway component PulJ